MTNVETDARFFEIFMGSPDAVGTEEGGCLRNDTDNGSAWHAHQMLAHLNGGAPKGVYPVWEGLVGWGCVDWDDGDEQSLADAQTFHRVAHHMGVPAYIELSRSKGCHGWVFVDNWVDMQQMRKALLVLCAIAEVPDREVNPKQMELADGQLGNYVRLPYPGRRPTAEGRRCFLDPDNNWYPMGYREAMESVEMTPSRSLQRLADMYVNPKPVFTPKYTEGGDAESRLRGIARKMWEDGPLETKDRSAQLWRFARYIAEDGHHSSEEAEQLVAAADLRWWPQPKYMGRTDGVRRVQEAVRDAFTRADQ